MKKLLFAVLLFPLLSIAQNISDTGTLRTRINLQIVPNGSQAITGQMLNQILNGYLNTWPDNRINAVYPLTWNAATRTLQFVGSMTGVPTTRKLTINGVQYDLTGDRSWSVGTVTNVVPGYGLTGGGTTTATLSADTTKLSSLWFANSIAFTNAKARAAFSATSPIIYNSGTGNFSFGTLQPANGGLGLTGVGTAGQMIRSTGFAWQIWTPNFLTGNDTISLSNRIVTSNLTFGSGLLRTGNLVVALNGNAIWNASKLQGYDVSTNVPTVDGQVLTWNATFHYWEARTFETGITETEGDGRYFQISLALSEGVASTIRTNLGGTTLGQNYFTLPNVSSISFARINADNTISTLSAGAFRTAIGSTTLGDNLYTITNPSAITFPRFNADNTVSALNAASFRTAIGSTTIGDAIFTGTNPSAIAFLRANADNSATWRSATNYLSDLGGTTVGKNLFTASNPSAITFTRFNADNSVTFENAASMLSDLGGQPLLSGTGFVKSSGGVIIYDNSSYQPLDADLTTIAGLTATTNNFIVSQSSAWASVTPSTVKGILAYVLASSDFVNQGTTTTVLHGNGAGNPSWGQIVNADVSASAGITYSKLTLTGNIVNADISASAAIVYSKLNLSASIVNTDIASGAAIAITKLASSTISGVSLGNNLFSLTNGYGISGSAYNGSAAITWLVDTSAIQKKMSAGTGIAISGNTIYSTGGGGGSTLTFNSTNLTGTSYNGSSPVTLNTIQDIAITSTPQFARLGVGVAADASLLALIQGDVSGGIAKINRSNANTSGTQGALIIQATSSGQMVDGFGSGITFVGRDADGVNNNFSLISTGRDGADNSGNLKFGTYNGGTLATALTIDHLQQVSFFNATSSTIAIFDASNNLISAATATYPSLTEFSYVKGVTSAIQTQFTGKQAALSGTGIVSFSGTTASYNTTSASIAGIISDETGTGALVFGTDPTFTTGITSDAFKLSTSGYNLQTGTTYTLVNSDNGKVITFNNASAITLTIPASLTAGFSCTIRQLGAGQVTFTASSTTLHNAHSYTKTAAQYALATIIYESSNTYTTGGDMQ